MFAKLSALIESYAKCDKGATAIEYGLIAGGISLGILAAVFAFGDDLESMFNTIGDAMGAAEGGVDTELGGE